MDIVGPLPADHRHEFLIVFVDCYSRYTILVPASNHTASTVSDALLRHVVPYFGTPCRLLSDHGHEFVGDVWGKLMRSLGVQRVLTSPYHPEGNAINERSHRTMNNMLRACLLEGTSSRPHAGPQRDGTRAAWFLGVDGRYRVRAYPSPRPPERCLRFSLPRQSHGLC